MYMKFIPKLTKPILTTSNLVIILVVVILFNLLSTRFLPQEIFLAAAANIDADELVSLTNSERDREGLPILTVDSRLVEAARKKGEHMLENDYWSHFAPDGKSPWDFISGEGYDYLFAGENLAKDFSSTAPIHNAWMNSPTHRENIVNSNFRNIGIAVVTGEFQGKETTLVVQMFGQLQVEGTTLSSEYASSEFEPILPQGNLASPLITYPTDEINLNSYNIEIKGKAVEGDEVYIFDNDKSLGTASFEEATKDFSFQKAEGFSEGRHMIYAKVVKLDSDSFGYSEVISFSIDTISPFINLNSLVLEYRENDAASSKLIYSIEIEDNPSNVKFRYNGEESEAYFDNGKWNFSLPESENMLDLEITASDKAGNISTLVIKAQEIIAATHNTPLSSESFTLSSWVVDNLFSRIFTKSLRGQINFFITSVLFLVLILERKFLDQSGLTEYKHHTLLHIPIFAVLLFVGLLGGGGEIL